MADEMFDPNVTQAVDTVPLAEGQTQALTSPEIGSVEPRAFNPATGVVQGVTEARASLEPRPMGAPDMSVQPNQPVQAIDRGVLTPPTMTEAPQAAPQTAKPGVLGRFSGIFGRKQ